MAAWNSRRDLTAPDGAPSSVLLSRWGDEPGRGAASKAGRPRLVTARTGLGDRWTARLAVLGALVGLVAAIAAFAPASWLAQALYRVSDQRVLLAQAQGTVWDGDAVLVLTAGAGSADARALPGRLRWSLRPAWDGGPALRLALRQDCCMAGVWPLNMAVGWRSWRLTLPTPASEPAWRAQWPGDLLSGLGTPWNTLAPQGQLRIDSGGLDLRQVDGRWLVEGGLDIEMLNMSSRVTTLRTLGSYRLRIIGAGAQPTRLELQTLDGALQLQGQGEWTARGVRFRGEATARPAEEAALNNLLNIIGRRDGARSILSIG